MSAGKNEILQQQNEQKSSNFPLVLSSISSPIAFLGHCDYV